MYEPGTILELKEPRTIEDKNGNEIDFPYNRVRVVNASPINHGIHPGEWVGGGGQGVIIEPLTSFAANLDEPVGKLQALYNVVETPVHEAPAVPVRVINRTTSAAGPTPEEVFAREAPAPPSPDGKPVRKRSTSPLEDPRPVAGASPLDEKKPTRRTRSNG